MVAATRFRNKIIHFAQNDTIGKARPSRLEVLLTSNIGLAITAEAGNLQILAIKTCPLSQLVLDLQNPAIHEKWRIETRHFSSLPARNRE